MGKKDKIQDEVKPATTDDVADKLEEVGIVEKPHTITQEFSETQKKTLAPQNRRAKEEAEPSERLVRTHRNENGHWVWKKASEVNQ